MRTLKTAFVAALLVANLTPAAAGPLDPRPANDDSANATRIEALPFSVRASTVGATNEVDDPRGCGQGASQNVWYEFAADEVTSLRVASPWGTFGRDVSIFAGTGTRRLLDCFATGVGASSAVSELRVAEGTIVTIRVGGWVTAPGTNVGPYGVNSQSGTFDLVVEAGPPNASLRPPLGDDLANPRPIDLGFAAWLPVFAADVVVDPLTNPADECDPRSVDGDNHDVWFTWTADEAAKVVASATWRGSGLGVSVYREIDNVRERFACSHQGGDDAHEFGDFAHVAFDAEAGATYVVRLWTSGPGFVEETGFALFEAGTYDVSLDDVWLEDWLAEEFPARERMPLHDIRSEASVVSSDSPEVTLVEGTPIWYGPGTLTKLVEAVDISFRPVGSERAFGLGETELAFLGFGGERPVGRTTTFWPTAGCTGEYDVTVRLLHPFSVDPNPENDLRTVRVRLDDAPANVPGCVVASAAS